MDHSSAPDGEGEVIISLKLRYYLMTMLGAEMGNINGAHRISSRHH